MDFNFSEEQQQLKDMLERFVRKDYSFEKRRQFMRTSEGFSRDVWREFANLGLQGVALPDKHGGLGGTAFDSLIVMEQLGRGLVVEPYLSTVVLCGGLLRDAASDAQQAELIPLIVSGECLLSLAHYEPQGRYELNCVATVASKGSSGFVLNGAKSVVLHGGSADRLIVSARTGGGETDRDGISVFLADAKAPGVTRQAYPTQDGCRAAEVTFKDVPATLIGVEGEGLAVTERALDFAIAALCAEAVGCMESLNEQTLEYLKTRKQFGVPIGTFQVLKHRMADMFMCTEQARSMAYLAAVKVHSDDTSERRRAISAAKALVGQSARYVGQQAVQLHGGMGVTDELAVSHYFKRLTMINTTFGDADHHLAQFSDQFVRAEAA